ncbi:adenosylcobinamide-phosphate synthase CbiB [Psychrilyobacter atlanticus]|uniref:adenosylcobinamide-phosphate synthase CbiB n=1 Tax=Psychrilyobacter atlanticus TaxID=271091 RepID=UPI0004119AC0|nr:adenosylcobinamide-phosphate synthase CbiB [Psychrilyobacter atlanticus]
MRVEDIILTGFILDLVFGDPRSLLHPVVVIGRIITFLEKILYKYKKIGGIILNLIVVGLTVGITYLISGYLEIIEIYLIYTIFATRSLALEGVKVFNILKKKDMQLARKELSYLVSRDTGYMQEKDIVRSVMETISENTVDGIISPLFFMVVGYLIAPATPLGVALAMGYKAINTLDSMVGYKNEKYKDFGWFSARVDDVANVIPARLTGGILIPISALFLRYDFKNSWKVFFRDRYNHASPNSAQSESAVAGALGVQFGGATSYFGRLKEKPTIGDKKKEFELMDIKRNIKLMYGSSILGMGMAYAVLILNGLN